MGPAIAIVGMACRYPDARSPGELWENALAQRRAFRRIPAERLNLNDYLSSDRQSPDQTYSTEGAFIEGYEFDRARFRVPGGTYRAADPAHWLTLDVAAAALEDAGFPEGEGLPREATGVFVGNTLTGEFSRANTLRLRWPYVRRVVRKVLEELEACPAERQRDILAQMESLYKKPFPPVGAETLAGGLSNTIAGRICNHFDLNGGGYTVDGACASSLLAVINACSSLAVGDLEVAIAGGIDLSIDPFELVGFAKTGALAADAMRVYDERSAGFWPGEGCGLVVLMRHEDALLKRRRIYAVIRGWGVSSDGSGGITRPEVEGQLIALRRAYARAGYGADTVAYFEGHGTGTAVGDATELQALARARREAADDVVPAVVSSVKAIIGHTKAAAGVAGLIKATMALDAQIIPPTVGCDDPHEELKGEAPALRALKHGELFATGASLRAGVSAMGFGGINSHVTLEAAHDDRRQSLTSRERALLTSAQDAELFLFSARDIDQLENQIERVLAYAERLSRGELTDLARRLSETVRPLPFRAAVVASSPAELSSRLEALKLRLRDGAARVIDPHGGIFLNLDSSSARIGFLFPGQGSPSYKDGGAWQRRFNFLEDLYHYTKQEWRGDGVSTDVAQPAIVASSVAALRVLSRLGITASVAVGHSLGEFTALHWARSMDESSLLRIARARGRAMADVDGPAGAMLSLAAGREAVQEILNGERVVIAGLNSPLQTVLSGEAIEINTVARRAEAHGLRTTLLRVSHAFHSSLVASAGTHLYAHLEREEFGPLQRRVFSTVTGQHLSADADLRAMLRDQVTSPVRFIEAVDAAVAEGVDLWIEVGPGQTLCGLIGQFRNEPAVALDAGGTSIRGLLSAVGACFCLGARVAHDELFADRFARPFDLDWNPRFFANPCELAPADDGSAGTASEDVSELDETVEVPVESSQANTPLEIVRRLVADRLELPIATIEDKSRLLDDLHLNSISVAQLVAEASRRLDLPPPPAPTHYANATLAEIASALEAAARAGGANGNSDADPSGVDEWVREFSVEFVERVLPRRENPSGPGDWRVFAPPDHPLKDAVQEAFAHSRAGRGAVVLLPPDPDESHIDLLLDGAREALKGGDDFRFVLVEHGGGAASFARSLHLEAKNLNTCVVVVPAEHPQAAAWILAEALATRGYAEARYSSDGRRWAPVLRPLAIEADKCELPLTASDVLVVSGGARGITAECALRLTRESGARLAIFGLSQPAADDEIVSNLERMKAAGLDFRYYSVDVTDAAATREAIREVETDLGPVTAILHGAARNVPCLIENLNPEEFSKTLAPKFRGAQNLLAAIDPARLHLFITFSSIIARTGLTGEAHYGLANEWLTRLTEQWQTAHPHCRCLAIEWSVWSGVGMGARLGTVDELARRGITPIPVEKGLDSLRKLLCRKSADVATVVMGRLRDMPTLKVERPELPFLRFLEKPRIYYPKIELIVDAELSTATDPYLDDHIFRGERLLPAVMGMEAMAQVVMALTDTNVPPVFEQVGFDRPVVVGDGAVNTIRVAALVRSPDCVDVVLRSSETGFQADHFRAVCRVESAPLDPARHTTGAIKPINIDRPVIADPGNDLYGRVLFHRGRFRRLREYRALKATQCSAEIMPDGTTTWFGRYLPGGLVLGDPGARDAAIHAVQACVPQVTLLPVGVERITGSLNGQVGEVFVHALEREQFANGFVYDVELTDTEGRVRERWERLHLHAVSGSEFKGPWPEGLLTPYVERCLPELIPGANVSVAFEIDHASDRRDRSTRAMERAIGACGIIRRTNGKPEACDGRDVSASHTGDLTMAVAGRSPIGCDLELVATRQPEIWSDILGDERFKLAEIISREARETLDAAATRVWTSIECLKKAGAGMTAPLVFSGVAPNGWILFASGELKIASCVVQREGEKEDLAIALLTGGGDARV
ncbi:MAG TPA: type I polyketide synthase [Pyrinomonadaceae bacterium]|nr:type I polyketide synthase [Pyrinomonadaceae bacterium]